MQSTLSLIIASMMAKQNLKPSDEPVQSIFSEEDIQKNIRQMSSEATEEQQSMIQGKQFENEQNVVSLEYDLNTGTYTGKYKINQLHHFVDMTTNLKIKNWTLKSNKRTNTIGAFYNIPQIKRKQVYLSNPILNYCSEQAVLVNAKESLLMSKLFGLHVLNSLIDPACGKSFSKLKYEGPFYIEWYHNIDTLELKKCDLTFMYFDNKLQKIDWDRILMLDGTSSLSDMKFIFSLTSIDDLVMQQILSTPTEIIPISETEVKEVAASIKSNQGWT